MMRSAQRGDVFLKELKITEVWGCCKTAPFCYPYREQTKRVFPLLKKRRDQRAAPFAAPRKERNSLSEKSEWERVI